MIAPIVVTEQEAEVLDLLVKTWNAFTQLDQLHPSDGLEFSQAIHQAQNILLSRPTMRALGTCPTETALPSKPKTKREGKIIHGAFSSARPEESSTLPG